MTKMIPSLIILGVALLVILLVVFSYFVGTYEASVDLIKSKIGVVACANDEIFEECSKEFIKLARETLEVREERINRWLYGIAAFLGLVTLFFAAFAILVALGGVLGTWQFRNLKEDAENKVGALDEWIEKSEKSYKGIQKYYKDIEGMALDIKGMTVDIKENIRTFDETKQALFERFNTELNQLDTESERLMKIKKQVDAVNELAKEADKIVARFDMIDKSMDDIIASEKTARGLETEMREILNSLKNSTTKK